MERKLDFLVVGAQKSGTTTLFKLLEDHPEVGMPEAKEAPFFSDDDRFSEGYDKYFNDFFSHVNKKSKLGTITPHYLYDPKSPKRIYEHNNQLKIIAVLRNPIYRAESHYKMSVRRGLETRSFSKAVDDLLQPESLAEARKMRAGKDSENCTYIVRGEYFRQIDNFLKYFPKNNIKIYFMDDLEARPQAVVDDFCDFIGVARFVSSKTGKKFHQGGTKEFVPLRKIASVPIVKWLWRKIPRSIRAKVSYWAHQKNTVVDESSVSTYQDKDKLKKHYRKDILALSEVLDCQTPWKEFYK